MTIRNMDHFVESLPDWAMLDGCFGETKIRPTDIDGMVEVNGASLFLEHKRPGVGITTGQLRAFKALVKQGNTVIVFWAVGRDVKEMMVLGSNKTEATLDDLRNAVKKWFATQKGG